MCSTGTHIKRLLTDANMRQMSI